MSLEYILLGLLDEPATGYDLKKSFKFHLSHFWNANLSQIYPTLKKLEKNGLVTHEELSSPIGPDRKVYKRTAEGKEKLLEWLSGEPVMADSRVHFAAQVFFLSEKHDPETAIKFFKNLKIMFEERIARMSEIEKLFEESAPEFPDNMPDEYFYPYLTLRMGFHRIQASIDWCEESIKNLEKRKLSD
jgi:DNA-binding PadR family transcriptional regulator